MILDKMIVPTDRLCVAQEVTNELKDMHPDAITMVAKGMSQQLGDVLISKLADMNPYVVQMSPIKTEDAFFTDTTRYRQNIHIRPLVLCGFCKHRYDNGCMGHSANWFCADGERIE